uniref:Uncharacterized protein n=1 Tax=Oryza sativa subsp. japonica TaxID=39947 RepID=Q7EZV8_ORYSJ|nr:hypothetical protein [Oryza sativa Japonica Group]
MEMDPGEKGLELRVRALRCHFRLPPRGGGRRSGESNRGEPYRHVAAAAQAAVAPVDQETRAMNHGQFRSGPTKGCSVTQGFVSGQE